MDEQQTKEFLDYCKARGWDAEMFKNVRFRPKGEGWIADVTHEGETKTMLVL